MARKQDRAAQPQTHSRATTTPRVRRAIQLSEEKNIALAKRYGVSRKTIAKWKAREFTSDARMGPTNPRASILTQDDEAIILAYRWRTRLPLDDCLDRLRRLMPKLSRSALYRCLRRRGLGRIGSTASSPPLNSPIGERRSTKTWQRSVPIPSRWSAAPTKWSTLGRFRPFQNPTTRNGAPNP